MKSILAGQVAPLIFCFLPSALRVILYKHLTSLELFQVLISLLEEILKHIPVTD